MEGKFVIINDSFLENGLTLEEAYILGRVRSFENNGLSYYESNETIAKLIGKSKSTVKKAINELVEKGYLNKEARKRSRLLSTNIEVVEKPNIGVVEKPHIGVKSEPSINELSAEEQAQRLQELINETRDPNFDITEEMY